MIMRSEPEYLFHARKLSLLTQLMLYHIRDSEQGIADFRLHNPNKEKFVGPKGLG